MIVEIQIIALSEVGEIAIHKLKEDDERETAYNRNKVRKQFDLNIISEKPLIYSAHVKTDLINAMTNQLKRAGLAKMVNIDTSLNVFMEEVRINASTRMKINGAVPKKDFVIRVIHDDDDDESREVEMPVVPIEVPKQ